MQATPHSAEVHTESLGMQTERDIVVCSIEKHSCPGRQYCFQWWVTTNWSMLKPAVTVGLDSGARRPFDSWGRIPIMFGEKTPAAIHNSLKYYNPRKTAHRPVAKGGLTGLILPPSLPDQTPPRSRNQEKSYENSQNRHHQMRFSSSKRMKIRMRPRLTSDPT